jgi:acetyl esterase/lipase
MKRLLIGIVLVVFSGTAVDGEEPARPLVPIAAKLEPTRQVVYKTVGKRELRLHIFEPKGYRPTDRRPVFLAIHGGGWVGGEPRKFYPFANFFARQGMLGVSLEYRLISRKAGATNTTVFDCVRDGRSAVRYLRQHARAFGIDPARIVVAGGSAGAQVAAGTALFAKVNDATDDLKFSSTPNALVLFYPVIDTSAEGYGQKKIGDRWRELSPVHHVRAGVPPTLIFHGTADTVTPHAGAVRFQKNMRAAGNSCQLISYPGGLHGYLIFDLKLFDQAMHRTAKFLQQQKILE